MQELLSAPLLPFFSVPTALILRASTIVLALFLLHLFLFFLLFFPRLVRFKMFTPITITIVTIVPVVFIPYCPDPVVIVTTQALGELVVIHCPPRSIVISSPVPSVIVE
jgi:hypothetical protein